MCVSYSNTLQYDASSDEKVNIVFMIYFWLHSLLWNVCLLQKQWVIWQTAIAAINSYSDLATAPPGLQMYS